MGSSPIKYILDFIRNKSILSLSASSVELTPMSELRATKEASKDSMLVKITPLKPSQGIVSHRTQVSNRLANSYSI